MAPADDRTQCSRWAMVTRLATASTHIATCSTQRQREVRQVGQPGAEQHDDQPLGPLDQPAVAATGRWLRRGP